MVSVLQSKLSMDARVYSVLSLLFMVVLLSVRIEGTDYESSAFNRSIFPEDFVFGTASASYQYEGAYKEDGRGLSNWDIYTHEHPERIADRGNGDVANDHYHRYKEDVQLMKDMGMDAYRFSISWSRVLPNGKLSGGVNQKGIQFYNNLIDEVLSKGLKPFVTIFHWDVPQNLEDEYGGFLSSRIVQDFQDYSELLFKEFGDRVKHWITLNEPWSFTRGGYNTGNYAPGHCSIFVGNCSVGNSATEPYIVSHNQLLAHAAAVKVYKEKYQVKQEGKIGITLVVHWMVPWDQADDQKEAAQRAIDFMFGWFIDPLTYGDYPETMKLFVKDRLPKFTKEQSDMLIGSYDFLGLNYYTAYFTKHIPLHDNAEPSYQADCHCNRTSEKNGVPIGEKTASDWLYVYPQGILDLLLYTKKNYKNPIIYITENGVSEANNVTLPLEEQLKDTQRIDYHYKHLMLIRKAIDEGVILKGYFAWSLLDNFEWEAGYSVRFGINYVDYQTLKRYPKHSSVWFTKFLLH